MLFCLNKLGTEKACFFYLGKVPPEKACFFILLNFPEKACFFYFVKALVKPDKTTGLKSHFKQFTKSKFLPKKACFFYLSMPRKTEKSKFQKSMLFLFGRFYTKIGDLVQDPGGFPPWLWTVVRCLPYRVGPNPRLHKGLHNFNPVFLKSFLLLIASKNRPKK